MVSFVELQGQAVGVVEEGEPPAAGVGPYGLALDAPSLQLPDGGLNVVHPEGQVTQTPGLRIAGPGRALGMTNSSSYPSPKLRSIFQSPRSSR